MQNKNIIDLSLRLTQVDHSHADFIDGEVLLSDKLNKGSMPTSPRRMTFILVALCTRGECEFTVDTQRLKITQNDLVIISDRHIVDNFQASDDADGLLMIMSVGFFYEVMSNVSDVSLLFCFARSHPVVTLKEDEVRLFTEYFFMLKGKMGEVDNRFRRDIVRTLILAMFYDLSNVIVRVQQGESRRQSRADVIFTRFIHLVEQHFRHERRVGWYAEQLCITPKYLSETVKVVSGRTPNEWVDSYVTLELRVMLKTTTKSIKEIAEEMNFPNQSFLGKFFREHVGVSPTVYRRS
ncbi:MAG: helix-turn-helix domain-containing protein [Prevotellaceae bacterium]|nr:helix-turn-helix domain-containing protein [Prevotellaceae bacterium]